MLSNYASTSHLTDAIFRNIWRRKIRDGTLLRLSSDEPSDPALSMVGAHGAMKVQTFGRHSACLALGFIPWRTCSHIATGVRLLSVKWATKKFSAMSVTMVSLYQLLRHPKPTLFLVSVNTPNGRAPPLVTGTFGSKLQSRFACSPSSTHSCYQRCRFLALTYRRNRRVSVRLVLYFATSEYYYL